MFNRVDVQIDSVEFESVVGGYNQIVNLERPDGVSYSQWSGVWTGFKELHDSRQYSLGDYVERQVDTSEIESLEDQISELQKQVESLEGDLARSEREADDLQAEIDNLEKELREVNYRLESLEK